MIAYIFTDDCQRGLIPSVYSYGWMHAERPAYSSVNVKRVSEHFNPYPANVENMVS
jgi:hypothetical protein